MAEYLIQDTTLTAIADAIRSKTGKTGTLTPAAMASEINAYNALSSALNFSIVGGTTQPVSPTENTIWVNTNVEIISWEFSATEPNAPEEGALWFSTGMSSTVEFNAVKENGIMIYPLSVQQFSSGNWTGKNASIYKNGAWNEFFPEHWFHYKGEGWNDEMGTYTGWGGATVADDEITISSATVYENYQNNGLKRGLYQTNKYDFSNFKKLKLEYKSDISFSGNHGFFFGVGGTNQDWPASNWSAYMAIRNAVSEWTTFEVDISSVNTTSRLRLMLWHDVDGEKVYIRNITLS